MTIVVALKIKNDVIIGSDSQLSGHNVEKVMHEPKFFVKTIKHNGKKESKIVVGLAGSWDVGKYLELIFKPPLWDKRETKDFMTYMMDKFLPAFKKLLNNKYYVETNKEIPDTNSHLLFIYDNEIYQFFSDFSLHKQYEDYAVIGSGAEVALGSLYSNLIIKKEYEKEIVKEAIEAASYHTLYCGGDVWVEKVSQLIK